MVVTDYNEQFLDKRGTDHLIDELKAYIDNLPNGNVDLSDYVTKSELQAKLDALHINIDLSSYATKEELTQAINSIDLSSYAKKTDIPSLDAYAKKSDIPSLEGYVTETELNAKGYLTEHQDLSSYALKTEIPSIDGLATTEYVDNAIANVPSGGNVDLSNYYTKSETYNKTEVDTAIENAIYGSYTFDPNFDFSGKTLYFDTTKNLASMLPEEQYMLYISDTSSTGYSYPQSIAWNQFSNLPKGRLTLSMSKDGVNGISNNIILYDINCADGETSQMGTFNNHWATSSYTFSSKFKTPVYGDFGDPSDPSDTRKSILGEELFNAFMSCVTRVVDADGNEVSFKILNKPEEIISPTVSITETDNGHTVSITDVNGTQSFDVTNGQNGTDGTNGTNGVSPTVTVTKEGKVATITCTDVNGTTTATISDGEDGQGGGSSSGGASGITYAYDTEIATGETYFDGRPIYMRIFHIDALSSAPSDYIVYGNYHSQTPFADTLVSAEPIWKSNSNQKRFTGNVVQSFYPASGSSGSAAITAVNRLLKTVAWVQAWQSSSEFAITVTRGQDMYEYGCDVFVKYVKSA